MYPDFVDVTGAAGSVPGVEILVVEDELLVRLMISEALRDEGYSVIEAYNADEALSILDAGKAFDLIISDVRMPGSMDGLGLLDRVRQQSPALPVILTSGHLEPEVALARGATRFVGKPYDLATMLASIVDGLAKPA
ncbi:MAG: response regulator [Alphaproteobacteria bacterium]|nr:MAG: response regulator [Alphaproteobacteria bacterium]